MPIIGFKHPDVSAGWTMTPQAAAKWASKRFNEDSLEHLGRKPLTLTSKINARIPTLAKSVSPEEWEETFEGLLCRLVEKLEGRKRYTLLMFETHFAHGYTEEEARLKIQQSDNKVGRSKALYELLYQPVCGEDQKPDFLTNIKWEIIRDPYGEESAAKEDLIIREIAHTIGGNLLEAMRIYKARRAKLIAEIRKQEEIERQQHAEQS